MTTFILIHGLGGGGWYWQKTTRALRARGHEVIALTLTGCGERCHLLTPQVDLDTHIEDGVNCLEFEDLHDVALVGHSYGGMVISGIADRVRERIGTAVYLDAFIPEDGQSLTDLLPPERADFFRQSAKAEGDGWRVPSPPASWWKLTDPGDIAWFDGHKADHPLASLEQPVRLTHRDGPVDRRAFIWAAHYRPSPFEKFAAATRDDANWIYREVPAGHMAMISHPDELTALLEEVTA